MQQVKIEKIKYEERLQNRVSIDQSIVSEYAELLINGVSLPDITVFFDGADYWLADGFHRYHAAKQIGALDINADVREGTLRDAILFAVGVNHAHGLKRTNADKRKAVQTLLDDVEWRKWSNSEIARRCHVSDMLVADVKKSSLQELEVTKKEYTTKHGTQAVMKTENIGKSKKQHIQEIECIEEKLQADAENYGEFDPVAELESANSEIDRLTKIVESDDQLAEAHKEIKRLSSLCETQQFRINSLMSEKAEAVRYAQMYKNKLQKLERQVNKADLVDF